MTSFEERKKLHEINIVSNEALVSKYKPRKEDSEIKKTKYKILFSPQNEKELDYAEASLAFIVELDELEGLAITGKTKYPSIENNKFSECFIELLESVNNSANEFNKEKYTNMSLKEKAKFLYDGGVYTVYGEKMIFFLCEKLGLNPHYVPHIAKAIELLKKVKLNHPFFDTKNTLEEEMEEDIKLYNEFHKVCLENRIYTKEDEKLIII